MKKYVVFLDMDGVIADFDRDIKDKSTITSDPVEMYKKGFFLNLRKYKGAKKAVNWMLKQDNIDLYIATKPLVTNLHSTIEKYKWIQKHFPKLLKKMFLTCDKSKLKGDFLIDDFTKWKTFPGTFIHFTGDWNKTIKQLKKHIND